MTVSTSQSTLASSSADSILTGSSASYSNQARSGVPTISMTSADADISADGTDLSIQRSSSGGSANGAPGIVARDYAPGSGTLASNGSNSGVVMQQKLGSESSLSSVEAAPIHNRARLGPNHGYDTGTETDMSGFSTGMDESNASTGEGTDTEAEAAAPSHSSTKPSTSERSGPKRSAQSLPRRALKRYLIASAPPVLIFHLKRFQATGRGFVSGLAGFKKIDDQVTFPEYLDITPWLAPPREDYDRRGRLKASSDPLAIRRRAEEEAVNAGVDARNVRVEVSGHRKGKGERKGRKGGMWSWHLNDPAKSHHPRSASANGVSGGDLEEGPKVHTSAGHEIVPSVVRRPKTEYRLYAVIVHQGSLSAGHYTAYVLSDRIKLNAQQKEMVARSAPTSRTNTPAPPAAATGGKDAGAGMGGFGNFFRPPSRATASPAIVPARPASAAPVAMTSAPSMSSMNSAGSGSHHDVQPQGSVSSLDTDASVRSTTTSAVSGGLSDDSSGPKLVRPRPQLKTMASWDSLDELEQSHASLSPSATPNSSGNGGAATPTLGLEPSKAVPTVASSNNNAHRHVTLPSAEDEKKGDDDDDDVDPRKRDDGRRWVYTSDTIVRAATVDEVLKSKAYMLFYERM